MTTMHDLRTENIRLARENARLREELAKERATRRLPQPDVAGPTGAADDRFDYLEGR